VISCILLQTLNSTWFNC